jgi:ubiquinone/menaquinone biosynthesis C-methylase UbiE
MSNDYNNIAGFYDKLSRVVYQRSIINAQVFLIQLIKNNDTILLAGGGTGWILEEISKLQKQNVHVIYVEKSSAMIKLAQKRKFENITVEFVEAAIEEYNTTEEFDIVFTAFLFDNFLKEKIDFIFSKLHNLLKQKGFWLYADFVNDATNKKNWQRILLKAMYFFFKLTAKIETQELIDMRPYFGHNYAMITQQFYYNRFIQAVAYKKITV